MDIEKAVIIDAMSFQTFMTLFILQNTKEDILKNVSVYFPLKKVKRVPFSFYSFSYHYMDTNVKIFFIIPTSVFHRKKPYRKEIRPSKWWHNF